MVAAIVAGGGNRPQQVVTRDAQRIVDNRRHAVVPQDMGDNSGGPSARGKARQSEQRGPETTRGQPVSVLLAEGFLFVMQYASVRSSKTTMHRATGAAHAFPCGGREGAGHFSANAVRQGARHLQRLRWYGLHGKAGFGVGQ